LEKGELEKGELEKGELEKGVADTGWYVTHTHNQYRDTHNEQLPLPISHIAHHTAHCAYLTPFHCVSS